MMNGLMSRLHINYEGEFKGLMHIFYYTWLLLSIVTLDCCQSGIKTTSDRPEYGDTTAYDLDQVKEYSSYFLSNGDQVDTTFFHARYPIFKDTKINLLLNQFIRLEGDTSMVEAAQRFIRSYDEYVDENDGKSTATWFRDLNITVPINTPIFLTLRTVQEEYTGGAHGEHITLFTNLDRNNDQVITLDEIVPKNKQEELRKIAERYFRKQEKLKPSTPLTENYFFENGIFTLADNFSLEKNSILFYYNNYEIKSFAEGPTELRIPYDDIRQILSAKGIQYINSIH